jgi:hypothetical protein
MNARVLFGLYDDGPFAKTPGSVRHGRSIARGTPYDVHGGSKDRLTASRRGVGGPWPLVAPGLASRRDPRRERLVRPRDDYVCLVRLTLIAAP